MLTIGAVETFISCLQSGNTFVNNYSGAHSNFNRGIKISTKTLKIPPLLNYKRILATFWGNSCYPKTLLCAPLNNYRKTVK